MQGCLFLQFLLSPYPPAERAPPTTAARPQPSLPRWGGGKGGGCLPRERFPARNAKVRASKAVGRDL